MHRPLRLQHSLWIFLTIMTIAICQTDITSDLEKGHERSLSPQNVSASETGIKQIQTPHWSEPSEHGKTELSSTTENMDPLDLHSALGCDRGSCNGRCGERERKQSISVDRGEASDDESEPDEEIGTKGGCTCDKNCIIFGDCCFDFFSQCLGTNLTSLLSNVNTMEEVGEMMQMILEDDAGIPEKVLMYLFKSCQLVHTINDKRYYYWMISDCPLTHNRNDNSSQNENEAKCHNTLSDPLGTVPASLKRQPEVVFRNMYCALCNGIDIKELQLWESVAKCPEIGDTSKISYNEFLQKVKTSECVIKSQIYHGARACLLEQGGTIDWISLYEKEDQYFRNNSLHCRSYLYPVITDSNNNIRNWHCGSCSETKYRCDSSVGHFVFYNVSVPKCEEMSCNGSCDTKRHVSKCQCDVQCLLFGDCCYDFIPACLGYEYELMEVMRNETLIGLLMDRENGHTEDRTAKMQDLVRFEETTYKVTPSAVSTMKEDENRLTMLYNSYRICVNIPGQDDMMRWTIGTCPDERIDPKCTAVSNTINWSLIAPASYKTNPGIVFKNIYCGLCHGVSLEDLNQWDVRIYCRKPVQSFESVDALLEDDRCSMQALELEGGRNCSRDDTNIFQSSSPADVTPLSKMLCQAYRYPVSGPTYYLRNPHCEQSVNVLHSCHSPFPPFADESFADEANAKKPGGLSILFNFNDNGVTFVSVQGDSIFQNCQSNEVYDHFHDICRKLQCQKGKVVVNGSCIGNGTWFAEERNMIFANGTEELIVECLFQKQLKTDGVDEILTSISADKELTKYKSFLQIKGFTITNTSVIPVNLSINTLENFQILTLKISKTGSLDDHLRALNMFVKTSVNKGRELLQISVKNFRAEKRLACLFGAVVLLNNPLLETVNGELYANYSDRLYPLDNIAFICSLENNIPLLRRIFVCDIPLECDPVSYNLTDFTSEDGSLKSRRSGLILSNGSYFVSGQQVLACHNFTHSPVKNQSVVFFEFDHVQDILTYVTSGISLASLTLTVAVYILLPELRNLPGRLTMSLSVSLILSQGLLLAIHLPSGILCQALAVALHFSWLCSFMWMTVMSFNLARTFTRKMQGSPTASVAVTHARFSIFAIGVPLVIVTASALLDYLDIPGINIGYGAHDFCWIANPRASLLVFGVPLALVIMVNLIAFSLTFYNIEKNMRASKDISSTRSDRYKVIIYGKLFVIMGLSWSFSFAAAFANIAALWYIFIILNGLQGFYIFISFICTNRVMRLLKKKILGQNSEESTSTNMSTGIDNI